MVTHLPRNFLGVGERLHAEVYFALLHLGIRRRLHAGKWETQCMECEGQYTENYSTTANGVSQYLPASTLTALKLKISLVNS